MNILQMLQIQQESKLCSGVGVDVKAISYYLLKPKYAKILPFLTFKGLMKIFSPPLILTQSKLLQVTLGNM